MKKTKKKYTSALQRIETLEVGEIKLYKNRIQGNITSQKQIKEKPCSREQRRKDDKEG